MEAHNSKNINKGRNLSPSVNDVKLKLETVSLRGIWKGMLTKKEIDESIKETHSKWRIDS